MTRTFALLLANFQEEKIALSRCYITMQGKWCTDTRQWVQMLHLGRQEGACQAWGSPEGGPCLEGGSCPAAGA